MMCLYKNLKEQGKEDLWWDYVQYVHMECFDYISTKCSQDGHKEIGVDIKDTQACIDNSFENGGKDKKMEENSMLKENAD